MGTYHQYNGGSIFGKWFDLTDLTTKTNFMTPAGRCMPPRMTPELVFQDWEGSRLASLPPNSVGGRLSRHSRQAQDEGRAAAFVALATIPVSVHAFDEAYWVARLKARRILLWLCGGSTAC
ncbi:hypothetical protein [Klebsiella pneumoniae]|uniref:hypothetical protein n=1 Tax=Klebsiella pneumoniae TaxID=573 RepID=UPI00388F755C